MFNLQLTVEYALEEGFDAQLINQCKATISLGKDIIICFENYPDDEDTGIYFFGSNGGWHSHGDLFCERESDIELVPINILQSLKSGDLLISKAEYQNGITEISLEYSHQKFDLNTLDEGESQTYIRVSNQHMEFTGVTPVD